MIIINNWKMDASRCTLTHQGTGETLRLGEFHFLLLEVLITHPDTVLSREFLIAEVWKNRVVGSNSLPTAIHALRLALGDDAKQKDIIKTIPKKGYFIDSEFITYPQDENDSAVAKNNSEQPESVEVDSEMDALSPSYAVSVPASNKKPGAFRARNLILYTASILAIMLAAILWHSFSDSVSGNKTVNNDADPQIKYFDFPEIKNITFGYLHRKETDAAGVLTIKNKVYPIAQSLSKLMTQHDATMKIYAYPSISKLSVDFTITNSCDHTWQVVLTIDNWQHDAKKLNDYIYHHAERTLNEMPKCE
ncbi:winged helix-turn-helix domain-containing protein [Scandinavium goeteborgense]|uniref:winged helix-turn-helix domain-containing protein n=1 Tax=Scandinavium goeteborgense TaxID=1851514 RepID=UPI002166A949|nr:winged helix-turn-helix domain-containing protein [Scandinavium goeteborgense]MCS2153273.1 winged helix-turn-helix domain-containing protein [Scandinavium goeteborgense]